MKEILTKTDFAEMLSQDKVVLSFYHDWVKDSVFYGVEFLTESENYFQSSQYHIKPAFWIANVSDVNSPANFLYDWLKEIEPKLIVMIGTGNPSVIWLSFGQMLKYEFSACLLKSNGIIEKTIEVFDL